MQYLDKDAILSSLTTEDISKIVMALGSDQPRKDSSGNLICQTICHNLPDPGNSWKLYYYHESSGEYKGKRFVCYTGCSDTFDIVELVIRANRVQGKTLTWYKALRWIGQITGKLVCSSEIDARPRERINDFEWINRIKIAQKAKKAIPSLSEINENILEMFYYAPHEAWLNDNISREALSRFEIGYYGLTNQITIPHRDKDGRLIGIRGRYLDEEDIKNIGKYVPLQIESKFLTHSLGNNLYGISVTQDKIKRCKKCMLVESEKGCLQAYTYFGDDSFVLATTGSNITLTQQKLLLNYLQVEEVIVAFDREYHAADSYEAEIYYNKLVKKVAGLVPYCRVYLVLDSEDRLPYKSSPTDMGKDVLIQLMKEKILITVDEVNRVLKESNARITK